jgi:fumarate reductase (CoM/CoB) subunit A
MIDVYFIFPGLEIFYKIFQGDSMLLHPQKNIDCDVLIIGSGGAGLRAAIAAASSGADVLMISKTRIGHATNTYLSKAIIASSGYGDPDDTSHVHSSDTIKGGCFLNDPDMVAEITKIIPSEAALLQEWGIKFAARADGRPEVIKIPGHTHARHLHGATWKGSDLVLPLKKKAKEKGVCFLEKTFISNLMVGDNKICGVTGIDKEGNFTAVQAKAIVLASGGFGHVYLNTNNAPGTTGDGQALACRAHVPLKDMEFVQFYPTCLGKQGTRLLLYEKLLEQDTVVLRNSKGQDILKKNHCPPPGQMTRDHLARVIMKEILEDSEQKGSLDLDLGNLPKETAKTLSMILPSRFSTGKTIFQVVPTTHFCMGGVMVDPHGQTACPGLFAAGEVTAGAHGANRLGGNALAEVIAMGGRVGRAAAQKALALERAQGFDRAVQEERQRLDTLIKKKGPRPNILIRELKKTMWRNAGIIRDQNSLERALKTIMDMKKSSALISCPRDLIRLLEFRNMRLVAELICRSARLRTESRGSHFRTDYPEENNQEWLKNIKINKTGQGLLLTKIPVPKKAQVLPHTLE